MSNSNASISSQWCPPYVIGQSKSLSDFPQELKDMIANHVHRSGDSSTQPLSNVDRSFRAACWKTKFATIKVTGSELRARDMIDEIFELEEKAKFMDSIKEIRIATTLNATDRACVGLPKAVFKLITSTPDLQTLTVLHISPVGKPNRTENALRRCLIGTRKKQNATTLPSLKRLTFHADGDGNARYLLEACPNLEAVSLMHARVDLPMYCNALRQLRKLHTINLVMPEGSVWKWWDLSELARYMSQVTNLALQGDTNDPESFALLLTSFCLHEMPRLQRLAVSATTTFWKGQVVSKGLQFWKAQAKELFKRHNQLERVCFLQGPDLPCATYRRRSGAIVIAVPAKHPTWLQSWDGR